MFISLLNNAGIWPQVTFFGSSSENRFHSTVNSAMIIIYTSIGSKIDELKSYWSLGVQTWVCKNLVSNRYVTRLATELFTNYYLFPSHCILKSYYPIIWFITQTHKHVNMHAYTSSDLHRPYILYTYMYILTNIRVQNIILISSGLSQ